MKRAAPLFVLKVTTSSAPSLLLKRRKARLLLRVVIHSVAG